MSCEQGKRSNLIAFAVSLRFYEFSSLDFAIGFTRVGDELKRYRCLALALKEHFSVIHFRQVKSSVESTQSSSELHSLWLHLLSNATHRARSFPLNPITADARIEVNFIGSCQVIESSVVTRRNLIWLLWTLFFIISYRSDKQSNRFVRSLKLKLAINQYFGLKTSI